MKWFFRGVGGAWWVSPELRAPFPTPLGCGPSRGGRGRAWLLPSMSEKLHVIVSSVQKELELDVTGRGRSTRYVPKGARSQSITLLSPVRRNLSPAADLPIRRARVRPDADGPDSPMAPSKKERRIHQALRPRARIRLWGPWTLRRSRGMSAAARSISGNFCSAERLAFVSMWV